MINKVTVTGADNSIHPRELVKLFLEYPFFEAGVLVSKDNYGTPRFPSIAWIDELCRSIVDHRQFALSFHGCGRYVKDLVEGRTADLLVDLYPNLDYCQRIQLNTHNIKHGFHADFVKLIQLPIMKGKEFIFQFDEANYRVVQDIAQYADANCSILFDNSGGRGLLPDEWPEPIDGINCGYAGGLSPENLREQIMRIEEKAGETPIWIDMETHVRSENDKCFDLDKVRRCLDIAAEFIETYKAHE